jgi:cytochrome c5
MMDRLKLAVILFAIAIFAIACGQAANAPTSNNAVANTGQNTNAAPSATLDQAALDKDLYAKNCMICHKDSGKSGKVTIDGKTIDPPDITTAKMKGKSDDKYNDYISEGFPDDGMPAFKDKLSPDQIKAIIRHVRVLQGS